MAPFESRIDPASETFATNRDGMLALIEGFRRLERRTQDASERNRPQFEKRGQLTPRERVMLLLDPGSPFLELASIAGYLVDNPDPEKSIPGGAVIAGIGFISGARCMVVANDSGINAGAMQTMTSQKIMRCQDIALENRLPFVHLVESAGGNLITYRVERFVHGGGMFFNLARLSAAGLPVIAVVHGSSTAGGAYLPGLSDYVVMVRGRAKAFLAGPPLLKAATGEIATDEELGGADMHATQSGLAEFVAEDDREAIGIARNVVASLGWNKRLGAMVQPAFEAPQLDPDHIAGIMPLEVRKPVDMREIIARIVDGSHFMDFKPGYGPATVCALGNIEGHATGFITNNGPLDPAGATKAVHFIQSCCQAGTPIVYLQNTTGFIVGKASESAGMIKHGSKMIQALSNANVPQITVMCGASFGAGNYGMCGRAFGPRFVFSWPNAKTAIMGGEQAATTMAIVAEAGAKRRGETLDPAAMETKRQEIIRHYDRQSGALVTSGLLLDDGIIDPRETRNVLAMVLATCREAEARRVTPVQFGVARA